MRLEISPRDFQQIKSARPPREGLRAAPARPALGSPDFQDLLQNVYDGVLLTDPEGRIVEVNPRAAQLLGTARDGLVDLTVPDVISGASPALLSTVRETLQGDRFVLLQATCVQADGTVFPAEVSVNRLRLDAQHYLSFFVRDITVRKQAEEQLRTGFNAMQNAGNGIAIADREANLEYVNPAMVRLLGAVSADDLRGVNFRAFVAEDRRVADIVKAVEQGDVWQGELELRRRGGARFFAQVSVAPNSNPEGELAGMVLSLLDTTSQRRAQRQLERYARELGQKNRQMEDDLHMAREIHQALLPRAYPEFPSGAPPERRTLRFGHLYHPSGIVGGDFLDVLPISNTHAGADLRRGRPRPARRAGGGDAVRPHHPARLRGARPEPFPHAAERGLPEHFQPRDGRADVRDGAVRRD